MSDYIRYSNMTHLISYINHAAIIKFRIYYASHIHTFLCIYCWGNGDKKFSVITCIYKGSWVISASLSYC